MLFQTFGGIRVRLMGFESGRGRGLDVVVVLSDGNLRSIQRYGVTRERVSCRIRGQGLTEGRKEEDR